MQANDIRECAEIVAAHPIVGPRYGRAIAELGPAWRRLLYSDGFAVTVVIEETAGAKVRKLGLAFVVFVSDNFLREAKTPPMFWVGPELAKRVMRGDSPILTAREVRVANARGGLNVLYWHVTVRAEAAQRADVRAAMMAAFQEYLGGFRLKELVVQADSVEHVARRRNGGGLLWNPSEASYSDRWPDDLAAIVAKPHLIGITRPLAIARAGSWVGSLFLLYQPPQIGFSRSEQRLLLSAMHGRTDQELSDELMISLATVKKTWRSIYHRVAERLPELISGNSAYGDGASRRGREKKQHLIAYLHEHPEELRPISHKALQSGETQSRRHLHGPAAS